MTDDIKVDGVGSIFEAINKSQGSPPESKTNQGNAAQVDQQEFLNLLVHQLQNQDPLNPMNSEEFAVQLAQFSQLEQLISINQKMDSLQGGPTENTNVGMLASFLGQEVVLQNQALQFENGKGPNLLVDVPQGTQSGRVDIFDSAGGILASVNLESLKAGKQAISMNVPEVQDGEYGARVVTVTEDGQFKSLDHAVSGTVGGFVMEPEPALLVNGKQVSLDQVVEVHKLDT